MDAVAALERIAFLLERSGEPTYRVRAFRRAAATIKHTPVAEVEARAAAGTLTALPNIGEITARVVTEALAGAAPAYLMRLEGEAVSRVPAITGGETVRAALRGDCHVHSNWSDGGSPIDEMARAARDIGHEYMVLTDHSPRLKVANGLSRERLLEQLDVVARLNVEMAPFRILTGIEVDILDDGSLDQDEDILARLDVVVGSVHSKLRMPGDLMTPRMIAALADPHLDILGHCTGRIVSRRQRATGDTGSGGRPESEFDAEMVFAAARHFDKAIEINSRPERLDPPRRLLRLAIEVGCRFSIDSDAHAPGQLEWLPYGCRRAEECEVPVDRIVNAMGADDLVAWCRSHGPSS